MDIEIETEGEPFPLTVEECVTITFSDGKRKFGVYKKEDYFDPQARNRVVHKIFLRSA
jgi:hypothetical protein